ncbi:hypothetical protein HPB50_027720 [Hyalomma asiaticum]|nr:hypothetical protein HPB50_027720 [Hyalomma asiaticum]
MAWDSRAHTTPVDQELLTMPPWEVPLGTRRKQRPIARRNVKARELLEKRLEQKRPQNTVDIHTDATIRDERASMAWMGLMTTSMRSQNLHLLHQAAQEVTSQPSLASSSRDDVEKMKEPANKNQIFVCVKVPEMPLHLSYKGGKEKKLEDLHDCSLVLLTLELRNHACAWSDLLMVVRNTACKVLLSQVIKQKLQIKSPGTGHNS